MKRSTTILITILSFLISFQAFGKYSGGTGEPNDPFLISTPDDLNSIGLNSSDWDKNFLMINDIDLSGYSGNQFNTIGIYDTAPFSGVFDGNEHTITGFSYEDPSGDNVGLFSYISGDSACIKNLGLLGPDVHGNEAVGALVGYAGNSAIYNCYVSGGTVQGETQVGVLIGFNYTSEVVCCYSTGSASADTYSVGGLIGVCSGGDVSHCYSTATVEGLSWVGGLVGEAKSAFTCDNCYAAGNVFAAASGSGGGLLDGGLVNEPSVYNCFWDYQTTGQNDSYAGGTKLSTAQMHDANNFKAQDWDFVGPSDGPSDLWAMPATPGYPILWWQLETLPELPVFSGGNGQTDNPYIISSSSQLRSIGYNPRLMEAHFSLSSDVNLAGEPFYTIGRLLPDMRYFSYRGVFEGNNNTVSNLSCPSDKKSQIGMFGSVLGQTAGIKNLTLTNIDINAPSYNGVAGLAGKIWYASIENCRIENAHIVGKNGIAGLVASNYIGHVYDCHVSNLYISGISPVAGLVCYNLSEGSEIVNCSAEGNISANQSVGGLVGSNYKGLVENCYADVNVDTSGNSAAGFAYDSSGGTIINCYAKGQVNGSQFVGGMFSNVSSNCNVIDCYTSCQVYGNDYTGGFVGFHGSGRYSGCFWNSEVNPDVNAFGYISNSNGVDVTALTTAQMQSIDPFTSAGWDFVGETVNGYRDTWRMCEDGIDSPKLSWEYTENADLLCPDGVDFVDYAMLAEFWKLKNPEQDYNADDIVNFSDWAYFAENWQADYYKFFEFVNHWLMRSPAYADIAPAGGDGIVDWQDLMLFCENWLAE